MASRSDDGGRIKPGITVDRDVWENFKEKYSANASQKVEELMKHSLETEQPASLFSSAGVESFSFNDPNKWNLSFTDSKIQVTNMSYSCSADGSGTTTDAVDMSDVQVYNMANKNIEIE